jgi:hypothetical protein
MKYLLCECCNFLAVVPNDVKGGQLDCPLCKLACCYYDGCLVNISITDFIKEAELQEQIK